MEALVRFFYVTYMCDEFVSASFVRVFFFTIRSTFFFQSVLARLANFFFCFGHDGTKKFLSDRSHMGWLFFLLVCDKRDGFGRSKNIFACT
jgi:hypothetical protein